MPNDYFCLEDNEWTPGLNEKLDENQPLVKKLKALDPTALVIHLNDDPFTISLSDIDAVEDKHVRQAGRLIFHALGCSGDPEHPIPQDSVAAGMIAQLQQNEAPSFLYHLGDIAYKPELGSIGDDNFESVGPNSTGAKSDVKSSAEIIDLSQLYNQEFYAAYKDYHRHIFAIPGNHDGKYKADKKNNNALKLNESSMWHFLQNFCALTEEVSYGDNLDTDRAAMHQPYPFWLLDTSAAYFIGLYTNVANGGSLDDPNSTDFTQGGQYRWLVNRLKIIQRKNEERKTNQASPKAVLIMLHYPPYSGAANFPLRGDPRLSKSKDTGERIVQYKNAITLGNVLQQAFQESGTRPDAVFSAHSHHYQRLTYTYEDGTQIPYLIVGSGGHSPVEKLSMGCAPHSIATNAGIPPLPVLCPPGMEFGTDRVEVSAYNDRDFGFLRVTVDENKRQLKGEFYVMKADISEHAANPNTSQSISNNTVTAMLYDDFTLDLDRHLILT